MPNIYRVRLEGEERELTVVCEDVSAIKTTLKYEGFTNQLGSKEIVSVDKANRSGEQIMVQGWYIAFRYPSQRGAFDPKPYTVRGEPGHADSGPDFTTPPVGKTRYSEFETAFMKLLNQADEEMRQDLEECEDYPIKQMEFILHCFQLWNERFNTNLVSVTCPEED